MVCLKEYCEQTSLHGWYYISGSTRKAWKFVWSAIVLTSIGVASVFIYKAAQDFTRSTVVTTIHSTTEPLSEVFFPAVTVCNINQVGCKGNFKSKKFEFPAIFSYISLLLHFCKM